MTPIYLFVCLIIGLFLMATLILLFIIYYPGNKGFTYYPSTRGLFITLVTRVSLATVGFSLITVWSISISILSMFLYLCSFHYIQSDNWLLSICLDTVLWSVLKIYRCCLFVCLSVSIYITSQTVAKDFIPVSVVVSESIVLYFMLVAIWFLCCP